MQLVKLVSFDIYIYRRSYPLYFSNLFEEFGSTKNLIIVYKNERKKQINKSYQSQINLNSPDPGYQLLVVLTFSNLIAIFFNRKIPLQISISYLQAHN
jgi:hypothetical protein